MAARRSTWLPGWQTCTFPQARHGGLGWFSSATIVPTCVWTMLTPACTGHQIHWTTRISPLRPTSLYTRADPLHARQLIRDLLREP